MFYLMSAILGGSGAWLAGRFGEQLGLLDRPTERSSHYTPTPKGGGIGILTAFILVCLATGVPNLFWIPASLISVLGLYCDRSDLSPKVRIYIQIAAAVVIILGTKKWLGNPWLLIMVPFAAVFVVGTANFYNFMDGINGIAGISGIISFGFLAFFALDSNNYSSFVTLSICMSFACVGFIPFNFPRAKVFMGDVGSVLLGFVFAAMVVLFAKSLTDFICLAAFLFPFYADEVTTMVVRIRDGEKLSQPHRRHLYQLMANELKISHWKVSTGYGLLQLIVGTSVMLTKPYGMLVVTLLLAAYSGGFIWVSFNTRRQVKHHLEPKIYCR